MVEHFWLQIVFTSCSQNAKKRKLTLRWVTVAGHMVGAGARILDTYTCEKSFHLNLPLWPRLKGSALFFCCVARTFASSRPCACVKSMSSFEFSNIYEYMFYFVSFGYNEYRLLKHVFVNIFIYCTMYCQGFHFRIESFTLKALRRTWPWCQMLSWKPGLRGHGTSVANRPCTNGWPQSKGHIGSTGCIKWATESCPTLHILQSTC